MITLPTAVFAILGAFAILGFALLMDRIFPEQRRNRIVVDYKAVNCKNHLMIAAMTSQAHRQGDPEF